MCDSVVPLVGTWIEIFLLNLLYLLFVVPLVGTWIEIPVAAVPAELQVVPLVGTWIEITPMCRRVFTNRRAPRGHVD